MSKFSNTLLALLLTLPDLEPPLTAEEQKYLNNVGDQLRANTDAPEIEPYLLKIVQANPTWSQLFTATKAKLDALGDNILQDLLPTSEEFYRFFPPESSKRREIPTGPIDDSTYIKNISMRILGPSPQESASQKKGLFAKLKAFLLNSSPSS